MPQQEAVGRVATPDSVESLDNVRQVPRVSDLARARRNRKVSTSGGAQSPPLPSKPEVLTFAEGAHEPVQPNVCLWGATHHTC